MFYTWNDKSNNPSFFSWLLKERPLKGMYCEIFEWNDNKYTKLISISFGMLLDLVYKNMLKKTAEKLML